MPQLQCPRCGKRFPQQPGSDQVCPSCGLRGGASGKAAEQKGLVGKHPRAWVAFLLGIVTLGIWSSWVRFRAYDQLDKQHGRQGGAAFYVLSLLPVVGLPFYVVHAFTAAKRLKDYRRARALRAGPGALTHLLLRLPFQLATIAVLVIIYINDWDAFGWSAFKYSQFNDGLQTGFDRIFSDVSFPDALPKFDVWCWMAVAAVGILLSAISAAVLCASTTKVWLAVEDEQGLPAPPASP